MRYFLIRGVVIVYIRYSDVCYGDVAFQAFVLYISSLHGLGVLFPSGEGGLDATMSLYNAVVESLLWAGLGMLGGGL